MSGDQGALNHALEGQFGTAWNDLVTSFENLIGRATSDAEKLALAGITTLKNDLATPLGQAAITAIGSALADAAKGETVAQIGAAVLPTLASAVVSDAKAAGQDAENVVLNTARVMILGQQAAGNGAPSDASLPAAPASPPANT
jgi:hypothetical protein